MRDPITWHAVRRWLIWPTAAALVVALGAVLGVHLAEDGRPLAAAMIVAAFAFLGATVANLLVSRLVTAQRLALRDALTGLPNRALLDDRIEQALARSQRTAEPFALLVVDIDGFKGVNDVRGHEAGNTVLRVIAKRLQAVVRGIDTVARVGGDEFVVLSLGTSSDEEAAALVGRLRNDLRRPYRIDGGLVEIDASIGWALFPQDGLTPGELLARADGQMYATKRDTSDENVLRPPLDGGVVRDLEEALEQDEIVVHYQPIVRMHTGEIQAVEALVRRLRSDRLVGPSEFVPHLERTPLVRTLTIAVAKDALARLVEWDRDGHRLDAAVNVPYRLIDDPDLVAGLDRLLSDSPIEPAPAHARDRPVRPGRGLGARRGRRRQAPRPRRQALARRPRPCVVGRRDPDAAARPGQDRRDVPPRRGSRRPRGRDRPLARRARPRARPRDRRGGRREPDGVGRGGRARLRPRAGLLLRPSDVGPEALRVARRQLARRRADDLSPR